MTTIMKIKTVVLLDADFGGISCWLSVVVVFGSSVRTGGCSAGGMFFCSSGVGAIGAAEALREKIHSPMTDYERVEYDKEVAQLRSLLHELDFNTLWAEGRALTMEQAIEFALN